MECRENSGLDAESVMAGGGFAAQQFVLSSSSGAEGDLFRQAVVSSGPLDSFALARAAGSPGLRGCAACRRMTKGGRGWFHFRPLADIGNVCI